jgi:hypothetical protein
MLLVGENQDYDDERRISIGSVLVSGSGKRFCSIKKGRSVQFQEASGVVRVLLTTVLYFEIMTKASRSANESGSNDRLGVSSLAYYLVIASVSAKKPWPL